MDSNHRPHAYQACALTSWAISPYGGDKEIRTLDPLRARQVLSQLSYTPIRFEGKSLKIEQNKYLSNPWASLLNIKYIILMYLY